jgi:hypothetical protein
MDLLPILEILVLTFAAAICATGVWEAGRMSDKKIEITIRVFRNASTKSINGSTRPSESAWQFAADAVRLASRSRSVLAWLDSQESGRVHERHQLGSDSRIGAVVAAKL